MQSNSYIKDGSGQTPKLLRTLNMVKCENCRISKKGCIFSNGPWPENCNRCLERGLECPKPERAGRGRRLQHRQTIEVETSRSNDIEEPPITDLPDQHQVIRIVDQSAAIPTSSDIGEHHATRELADQSTIRPFLEHLEDVTLERQERLPSTPISTFIDFESSTAKVANDRKRKAKDIEDEEQKAETIERHYFEIFQGLFSKLLSIDSCEKYFFGTEVFDKQDFLRYVDIGVKVFVLCPSKLNDMEITDVDVLSCNIGPHEFENLRIIVPYMINTLANKVNYNGIWISKTLKSLLYVVEDNLLHQLQEIFLDTEIFVNLLWCWDKLSSLRSHRLRILVSQAYNFEKRNELRLAVKVYKELMQGLIQGLVHDLHESGLDIHEVGSSKLLTEQIKVTVHSDPLALVPGSKLYNYILGIKDITEKLVQLETALQNDLQAGEEATIIINRAKVTLELDFRAWEDLARIIEVKRSAIVHRREELGLTWYERESETLTERSFRATVARPTTFKQSSVMGPPSIATSELYDRDSDTFDGILVSGMR